MVYCLAWQISDLIINAVWLDCCIVVWVDGAIQHRASGKPGEPPGTREYR